MTTYSFNAIYTRYDNNDNLVDAGMRTVSFVMAPGASSFDYSIIATFPGDMPLVEINNFDDYTIYLGGSVLESEPEIYLGSFSFSNGNTTQVLTIEDTSGNDEQYFIRIGGDPAPNIASASEFQALENSVTGIVPITSGPLAPGQTIQIGAMPDVSVTEHDRIVGTDQNDTLEGGVGNDTIFGLGGDDRIRGDDGNDSLIGGTGRDNIGGGGGNDLIDASQGDSNTEGFGDFIQPGLGRDTIIGNQAIWNAGEGIDIGYQDLSGVGGLTINANSGRVTSGTPGLVDDTFTFAHYFIGSQDSDVIIGSARDWEGFQGQAGNDTIDGREGYDEVSYRDEVFDGGNGAVSVDMRTGFVTDAFGDTDRLLNIERIRGTDLNDSMIANDAGGIRFQGEGGDDTLRGGAGDDEFIGGDGDDSINPGSNDFGYDYIEAGRGNDIIDYADNTASGWQHLSYRWGGFGTGVTFDVDQTQNTASISKPGGETDTIRNLTNATTGDGFRLEGTEHADTYNIRSAANQSIDLQGNEGNDTFNLTLEGYISLNYGHASSAINFDGQAGRVWSDGQGGTDTLNLTRVAGSTAWLNIRAGDGNDSLLGTDGSDRFITERGNDTVDGDDGWDSIRYDRSGVGAVNVDLQAGAATGSWEGQGFIHTLRNLEEVRGSRDGNDTLRGDGNDNRLEGRGGNDLIEGRAGNDQLRGEDGNDTLRGGDGNDDLRGGAGNDVVDGGAGDDWLVSDGGSDQFIGGAGFDWLYFDGRSLPTNDLIFNAITGINTVPGVAFGQDTISGIEGYRMEGDWNATVIGDGANNDFYTDAGNDSLAGGGGDDTLRAAGGNDTLNGGQGNDLAVFDVASGAANVAVSGDNATVTSSEGTDILIGVERLAFGDGFFNLSDFTGPGSGDETLIGTAGNDTLDGRGGNDRVEGLGGNDSLMGGTGNDTVIGDAGSDTLRGGDGADRLIGGDGDDFIFGGETSADLRDEIFAGAGNDSVDAGYGNDSINGDAGNDTIEGGFGVDTVVGGDGDDVLTGSAWSDAIFGGNGRDFINGGFGFDRVNGGAHADRFFHLGVLGHGSDWIQDYNAAQGDVLQSGIAGSNAGDYILSFGDTPNAGVAGVSEAFIRYAPTGQILWALVDGGGQSEINLQLGGSVFDLMA